MVFAMAATTMQLDTALRDELAQVARQDFQGATLAEALRRLVMEHRLARIAARLQVLRADSQAWADYQAEAALTDNAAGDAMVSARDEYPEANR